MTDTRTPPADLEAEQALLYALLRGPAAGIEEVRDLGLTPEHLYRPDHQAILLGIFALAGEGARIDPIVVVDAVSAEEGIDVRAAVLEVLDTEGSVSNVNRYARIVMRHAAARRLILAASEAAERSFALEDPGEVALDLIDRAGAIDAPSDAPPRGHMTWAEMGNVNLDQAQPWVVPGLFRQQWRVIGVGPEGHGKSLLSAQLALCTAAGLHPLSFERIEPQPTLTVMLENRADTAAHHYALVQRALSRRVRGPVRATVWHRPEGIDLRSAKDRAAFVEVLGRDRPGLVCLCPAYKAFKVERGENYEQATGATMRVLDELMARYGFAIFVEHHAGKKYGGSRDLDPSGSAWWLRWPEIGLQLKPDGNPDTFTELSFGRFRGDRVPNGWPEKIVKGQEWPWEGVWSNGHFA